MSSRRRSPIKSSPEATYCCAFSVEIFVKDSCGVTKTSLSAFRPQPSAFSPQTSALRLSNFSPQTSDFRLQPSDLRLQTSAFSPQTSAFRLQTSALSLQTSAFSPQPSNLSPQTFKLQPSDFRLPTSAFSPQPSNLSLQPSNLSLQTSNFRPQPSDLSLQPSAFKPQPSALSPQPSPPQPPFGILDSFGRFFCRHRTYRILFFQYRIIVSFGTMVLQPDMVERKSDGVKSHFTLLRLQFTFPYRYAMPSHFSQRLLLLLVAHLVPSNLLHPEVAVCLRNLTTLRILRLYHIHVMPMPEAAIHEDAGAVFPQYQVRMPRQPFVVQPVSESPFPQPMSHDHFRLRVLRTNSRHVFVPLFFSQMVRHRI